MPVVVAFAGGARRARLARRRWWVTCLAVLAASGFAAAQQCTLEVEPNGTPATATRSGASGAGVQPARSDEATSVCFVGTVSADDPDMFRWDVSETDATYRWVLQVEGPAADLTAAQLFAVTFADDGVAVTAADELLAVSTQGGASARSRQFLVGPGSYYLGVSAAGAGGEYVVSTEPVGSLYYGDEGDRYRDSLPERSEGAFGFYGGVTGELRHAFTLDEAAAGRVWGLELWAALGSTPRLVLEGPGGVVVQGDVGAGGRVSFSGLGLSAGEYAVRVDGASGMVRLRLASQGVRGDGVAVEPNDHWESATHFPPGTEMRGVLQGVDLFRVEVTPESAGYYDLDYDSAADLSFALTLVDEAGGELLRGRGASRRGLLLAAGVYRLDVWGAEGAAYRLALAPSAAPSGGEIEPNDQPRGAAPLPQSGQVRGRLEVADVDHYLVQVEDAPRRYRAQLVGPGVTGLALVDAAGGEVTSVRGSQRLRLDDIVLLPGANYLRVTGSEGEYGLKLLDLGEAVLAGEAEGAPAPDEPIPPAAAGAPEQDPAAAAAALEDAPLEAGPPPPPGRLELEPNDDESRAMKVVPGHVYVGRLSGGSDDYYRFFLDDDQYVRLEVVPPSGGAPIPIRLAERGWVEFPTLTPEGTVRLERYFHAGDHGFFLRAPEVESSGYYQLRLTLLGRLQPAVDAEPNDSMATAATLPAELAWDGHVGEYGGDYDYYRLPVFPAATTMTLTLSGALDERAVAAELLSERERFAFTARGDALGGAPWQAELPAGEQVYLRLSGRSPYQARLAFAAEPDPAQLLPPRVAGDVAVTLEPSGAELAAYWHEGQALTLTARVENRAPTARTVAVEAASSNAAVELRHPAEVTLQPGETREVPVEVLVPSDMRDDLPLRVEVAAGGPGGVDVAAMEAVLTCEAPPVGAFPYWPLPRPLLGHFDVLGLGFGAGIHGESGREGRDLALIDGRVGPSYGGYVDADHSATFKLAGDAPVTLVGTTLDPRSDGRRSDRLDGFRIETSLDGETFTTAFTGRLGAAPRERAFLFEAPVAARYARLVFESGLDGRYGYVGEWKLIAADPWTPGELNLAAPEHGGHVVRSEPYLGSGDVLERSDRRPVRLDLRDHEAFSFVVGFHDNRAAQVTRLTWTDGPAALQEPGALFPAVTVEVSIGGGAGPWEPLADWRLERDADGTATLRLDAPTWARFLRFTAPKVVDAEGTPGRHYYAPDAVAAYERVADESYRSALAEWGTARRAATYEYMTGTAAPAVADGSGNDSPATATQLAPGQTVAGTVEVAVDEDWYRLSIPAGHNYLELALGGDPTIAFDHELVDAAGAPVGYDVRADGDGLVLTLYAAPGDYYLHLFEPKRSVVFSWDTSGSVSSYQAITYNSLAAFATGLNGEREAAQLLAFDSPRPRWLMPYWSTDPARVQRAITEFDRDADSSNSEAALLAATVALADRDGTRAILLMTDAESDGGVLTPELWQAFDAVRPRVFTFEISSGGTDYAQDLMQDWADVNGGVYSLAAGVGEFDVGFARASCLLRRPKRYTLELTTAAAALPGPGSLVVRQAPGAAPAAVEIVFDASGSMGRELPSGEQRITAAKRTLAELVGEVLPEGTPFALRAFGHITPTSCESRLDVPFGPLDRAEAMAAVEAIAPKLLSQTPIADSLLNVPDDLAAAAGARTVILITDGEESCGGDPAEAVREARKRGPLDLAIVSLGLEPEALAVFERLAADVGASYVDVASYEALAAAVAEALNPAFEVYVARTDELVARGRVGGEPLELAMGVYDVRVLTAPVEEFRAVRVPGEKAVALTLSSR